jgi:hypothetical protein
MKMIEGEAVADQLSSVSYEHLHQLRACELEEGGIGLRGAGSGEEGLAGTGRSVHQCTCTC